MTTNIGNVIDPFYRYKRPIAIITIKNNKVLVLNIEEIASALHTKVSYILHYFKLKLSVSIGTKGEIQCNLDKDGIENTLNQFIEEYILCQTCGLPELTTKKEASKIFFICNACGDSTEIKENKMTKIIIKDYK